MLLRVGSSALLLVIVLWSWEADYGVVSSEGREQAMPEGLRSLGQVDVGEGFSLGLVRTRSLIGTRRYEVPPFFASLGVKEGASVVDDPFAEGYAPEASYYRSSAREILRARGIEFEEGTSASYDSDSSELVVTNRTAQLDLVDEFIKNLRDEGVPRQIKVEVKAVEITQTKMEELGFGWLMDAFQQEPGEVAMESESHAKAQRREGFLSTRVVRHTVVAGVFVWVLVFLLWRWHRDELQHGRALDGDQSTEAQGMEALAEPDQDFSLGLRRVDRKPPSISSEEGEVPYFLRRVDDRGGGEIIVRGVINLEGGPSSDVMFSKDGSVLWGGGHVMDVLDPEVLPSIGSERLEDTPEYPPPDQGE